jgi:hypothetical protein
MRKKGIWIGKFGSAGKWVNEFISDEAKVTDTLGAAAYTFDPKVCGPENEFEHVGRFLDVLDEDQWYGVAIALSTDELADAD